MTDEHERRRGERISVNREFDELTKSVTYVSDLSEHGVFVHTAQRIRVGTELDLRFTVLLDDPVSIHGRGVVVRQQDDPSGLGIEFRRLDTEMVDTLREVIARRPLPAEALQRLPTGEFSARSPQADAGEGATARTRSPTPVGELSFSDDDLPDPDAADSAGPKEPAD